MSEYVLSLTPRPDRTPIPSDTALQIWRVDSTGEERKVTYLSTLIKHTQAVNVVRFSPKGREVLPAPT